MNANDNKNKTNENSEKHTNLASDLNRELFRHNNRAAELNTALFDGIGVNSTGDITNYNGENSTSDDFGSSELLRHTPVDKVWKAALACALCLIMGFFGAVVGIYALSQAGYTDSSSLLGDLIVDASGLEVHKITANESHLNYTGGYIETTEKAIATVVELKELKSDGEGGYEECGSASGVIISEDGYIVTNEHVTEGINTLRATLSDGTSYYAKVIAEDAISDIALIKLEELEDRKLTSATFGVSADIKYGQSVIVIGNPMGIGTSVSTGIVSCPDREITTNGEINRVIQTDAAVSKGNSGGGMFDVYGNLIGILCAKTVGDGAEGLGYAVPIDTVKVVLNDLMDYGYVRGRAAIGITIASVTTPSAYNQYKAGELADFLFGSRYGIYVTATMRSMEIKRGDRLVIIEGMPITSTGVISEALKDKKPGDKIRITLERLTPDPDDGNAIETHDIVISLMERNW